MDTKIHPVLQELLNFGCSDKRAAPVAFAVYMDLAEVKAVWDLQYVHCKDLDLIYLTGKENEDDSEPNVYVPLAASSSVSPAWLLKVQNILQIKSKGMVLALKDADSTVVYYQISEGLTAPDSPELVQRTKAAEEKKKLMQGELWRKRNQLYEIAKNSSENESNKDNLA